MISIPKFRLGTIFLFFFCYAIGLTVTRDALGAVEPAIAVAILIGLGQEIRQLWRWTPPSPPPRASFTFARRFAVFWRCVVGMAILAYFAHAFVRAAAPGLRDSLGYDGSTVSAVIPQTYVICILLVLCNSIERWRPKTQSVNRALERRSRWLALLAVPIAALVLLGVTLTMFILHWATSNIEAKQPPKFHRQGVYIKPADEHFLSFWLGSLAVLCAIIGAILLLRFIHRRNFATASLWHLAGTALLLAISAMLCGWFFCTRFPILSPDVFGNGFEATHTDWLFGCVFGVGAAVVVAYKVARSKQLCEPPVVDVGEHPEAVPFHQTPAVLCVVGLHGLYNVFAMGRAMFGDVSSLAEVWSALVSILSGPLVLIILAEAIASIQLCWIRWKYRAQPVPWRIAALSRSAYYEAFIATIVILAIAVPTLHAYSFICWLMPWNLKALFGY